MKLTVEMNEDEIRQAIARSLADKGFNVDPKKLPIEVKSKQNYRSEWEQADIRVKASLEWTKEPF